MPIPENLKIVLATGEEYSNKRISLNFTSLSPHIQIFLPSFQNLARICLRDIQGPSCWPWTNFLNIDTKAKFRHLKKLTCKGTLRRVFIRVHRMEIQSVMLVFLIQLYELLPL